MLSKLLISLDFEKRVEKINKILIDNGLPKPHPDLLYLPYESKLGIEQARGIKEFFALKPYSAKGRVVVLEDASNLTIEAQNALLKTLEEPPSEAILILGAPSDAKFLPTILSRCQVERLQVTGYRLQGTGNREDIEKLLQSSIEERFEYIEKLREKEDFLRQLVGYFRNTFHATIVERNVTNHQTKQFLKELLKAEEWANQNVNIRAILEYLMLIMPRI